MTRPIPEERSAKIRDMYLQGYPLKVIAAECGYNTVNGVIAHIKKLGLSRRYTKGEVVSLSISVKRDTYFSLSYLARQANLHLSTYVRRILSDHLEAQCPSTNPTSPKVPAPPSSKAPTSNSRGTPPP